MSDTLPLLSFLIWLPIIGGIAVLLVDRLGLGDVRWWALGISALVFLMSISLWTGFDTGTAAMQFVERAPWIETLGAYYHLGVDGLSMPMILLTTFMTVLVVVAGWVVIQKSPAQYFAAFLFLEGFTIGVFSSLDAVLFYVFWEALLIPMFIIIGIWGGPDRVYATIKFFLYTFFGSVFMLVALIYLYVQTGSTAIHDFHMAPLGMTAQLLIFGAFFLAFAVKVPMWPVHTWLPDAHVQAPTGGSVILAAILLKLGAYGFLRFSLPITPDASAELAWIMVLLSLIAVAYIGLVALVQSDMKKLIAYSSIAHMGFATLGFFVGFLILVSTGETQGSALAMQGGIVQMVSHGFISGALFLCVGVMYDRVHSREIADYGGVINRMPVFAAFMVLFAMANAGLPGTSGFVGEFMVILASFRADFWIAFVAALTLILGAAYTLWMVKRVMFGEVANEKVEKLDDINGREIFTLTALTLPTLLLGVWPAPLIDVIAPSVDALIEHMMQSKL